MASVTDIIAEMSDVAELLKSKAGESTKQSSVQAVVHKIAALGFMDVGTAVKLHRANDANGMPEAFASAIQQAIDARLEKGTALQPKSAGVKDKKEQQLLTSILAYLTEEDWAKLQRPRMDAEGMIEVIASRYARLGVQHLDEQTVKWPCALCIYLVKAQNAGSMPMYQVIHDWVQKFKAAILSFKTPWDLEIIIQYPASPESLPPAIWEHAYTPEDPPVSKTIPGFSHLGEHVPLRSNSALLTREKALLQAQASMGMQMHPYMDMSSMQSRQAYALQQQMQHSRRADPIPDMVYHGHQMRPSPLTMQSHVFQPALPPMFHTQAGGAEHEPAGSLSAAPPSDQPHAQEMALVPVAGAAGPADGSARTATPFFRRGLTFGPPRVAPEVKVMPGPRDAAQAETPDADYDEEAYSALKKRPASKTKKPSKNDDGDEGDVDGDGDDCDDDSEAEGDEDAFGEQVEAAPKAMKAPAGKKAPIRKPAAAAPASVSPPLKRPASEMAMKVFKVRDLKVTLTPEEFQRSTMKNLGSMWYHRVESTLLRNGVTKEEASKAARAAFKKLNGLWSAMDSEQNKKSKSKR